MQALVASTEIANQAATVSILFRVSMRSLPERMLLELLGSFCLAYAVVTSFALRAASDFTAFLSIGLALIFLIHLFGRSSGAHFNPSVSLMFYGQNTLANPRAFWTNLIAFMGYATAQVIGIWLGFHTRAFVPPMGPFSARSMLVELVMTLALFWLIHAWSDEGKICPEARPLSGFVVGSGLTSLLFLGFADSIGIFNPAFTLAFMSLGARGLEQILVLQLLSGIAMIFAPRPLLSATRK
jgi:glycerol uptake facilitator-like aquaporin